MELYNGLYIMSCEITPTPPTLPLPWVYLHALYHDNKSVYLSVLWENYCVEECTFNIYF